LRHRQFRIGNRRPIALMIVALFTYSAVSFYSAFSDIRHSPHYPLFLVAKVSLAAVVVVFLVKVVLFPTKTREEPRPGK
jgi:hypothetical protein